MRHSELFAKIKKIPPKEAESISHKLLARADFIDQLASGVYGFLPLGWQVHQKIENIIREEMEAVGGAGNLFAHPYPQETLGRN